MPYRLLKSPFLFHRFYAVHPLPQIRKVPLQQLGQFMFPRETEPTLCNPTLQINGSESNTALQYRLNDCYAVLRRNGRETEHSRRFCSGLNVTSTKSLSYIVKPMRVLKRKVRRPSVGLL